MMPWQGVFDRHMPDYLERSVSTAAIWARRLAWFSLVLFATAGLAHRYGFLDTPGFFVQLAVVAALALLALALAAVGFSRLWNHGDQGGRNVAAAVLLAGTVLAPFALLAYGATAYPVLNDISTDLDEPPGFIEIRRNLAAGMNPLLPPTSEQRRIQAEIYPQITGRRYDLQFDRAASVVNDTAKAEGWTIVRLAAARDVGETTVEAVAFTPLLSLPSDVAIRLTDEGDTTYVDMRSASRYGDRDFGGNAARIAGFLQRLDANILALAGMSPGEQADDQPAGEGPTEIPVPEPRPSG